MRFLNYVIDLANQDSGEKDSDGEMLSLGDCFQRDMGELFKMIEDEDNLKKMKFFESEEKRKEN